MAGGKSCVKVRRGFSSAGSSPSNSSERFCSDVDMSVWWKKNASVVLGKKSKRLVYACFLQLTVYMNFVNTKGHLISKMLRWKVSCLFTLHPMLWGVPSSRQLVSRIPIMDFQSHDYRNDAAIIIILFWTFLIVSNSPELSVDSHTW